MGTRHRQAIISKRGVLKVQQYGQWDGYPSGQGLEILNYLRTGNLKTYLKNVTKLKQLTKKQIEVVNANENWPETYPYLSRDCGSRIHEMIEKNTVPFVMFTEEDECRKWCEGFYTIDFQKGVFISEYYDKRTEYPLDKLPTDEEYLAAMEPPDDEE